MPSPLAVAGRRRSSGRRLRAVRGDAVVVGSKNFTEQVILGELVAQAHRGRRRRVVDRKLNLGGTFVCDRALRSGDLDVYVEYTGTAVTAVFHEDVPHDPSRRSSARAALYARSRTDAPASRSASTTRSRSSCAPTTRRRSGFGRSTICVASIGAGWTPGFGYEFLQRADGYPGLVDGLRPAFARRRGRWICR